MFGSGFARAVGDSVDLVRLNLEMLARSDSDFSVPWSDLLFLRPINHENSLISTLVNYNPANGELCFLQPRWKFS